MARGAMRKNIKFSSSEVSERAQQEGFLFVIIIFLITHKVVYYSATKGIPSLRDLFVWCVEAGGSHHRASMERTKRRFSHCLHARITFHDDKRLQLILIVVVSKRINTRLRHPPLSAMKGCSLKRCYLLNCKCPS